MKKLLFNPKLLTKAERIYLNQLKNRPADTIFSEVTSKVHQYLNKPKQELKRQGE
jgi:hypothetical protein